VALLVMALLAVLTTAKKLGKKGKNLVRKNRHAQQHRLLSSRYHNAFNQQQQQQQQDNWKRNNYDDFFFDDYGEDRATSQGLLSSSGKYLQSRICGQQFLCRRGDRGPCQRNEVFVDRPKNASDVNAVPKDSCLNFNSNSWNGCHKMPKESEDSGDGSPVASIAPGCCSLRFSERPCFGYPPSYRYYTATKRCYPCSKMYEWASSGPCAPNKIFLDADGVNGMCRCRDGNHQLWKSDDRCYRIFAKGPCKDGEWFEPEGNGYGQCRASPCPEAKSDGRHIYWKAGTSGEAGCYKSFTRGPCRRGNYFLIDDFATKKARCVSQYRSVYQYPSSMYSNYGKWAPYSPYYSPYQKSNMGYYQQQQYGNPWMSRFNRIQPSYDYYDYDDYDLMGF